MPPVIVRYQLDPTGVSSDNLVQNEEHVLANRRVRSIAPTYGAYYANSVVLIDAATNLPLIRDIDWYPGELYEVPTARYGKDIYAIIVITNQTVSNNVVLQYQAVGGDFSTSDTAIIQLLDNLSLDNRPISWPNVAMKPATFPPSFHLHDVGDVYGFEYVVHALERIRAAIEFGDEISHDQIYKYIDAKFAQFKIDMTAQLAVAIAANTVDQNNPMEDEILFLNGNYVGESADADLFFMVQ